MANVVSPKGCDTASHAALRLPQTPSTTNGLKVEGMMANELVPTKKIKIKVDFGARKITGMAPDACVLLDCSGSMAEWVEPGRSKMDAVQELYRRFEHVKVYGFADNVQEISSDRQLRALGETMMAHALTYLKQLHMTHVVMVTDGRPSESERECLDAAQGMRVDVLYVGPHPAPAFLSRFASSTGGTYTDDVSLLLKSKSRELERKVAGLLRSGKEGGKGDNQN